MGEGSLSSLLSDGLGALDQPNPPTMQINPGFLGLTSERVIMNKSISPQGGGLVGMDKLLFGIQEFENKVQGGKGKKRKLSDMDADSTNCPDTEPTTSTGLVSTTTGVPGGLVEGGEKSTLTKSNQLLAQLLNERPTKEHSVNTLHTVTPVTATPQARLPKDLNVKLTMRGE